MEGFEHGPHRSFESGLTANINAMRAFDADNNIRNIFLFLSGIFIRVVTCVIFCVPDFFMTYKT